MFKSQLIRWLIYETGEPLLQVGIAYKHLKDKMAKEKAAEAIEKEKNQQT